MAREDARRRVEAGEPVSIRFRVPRPRDIVIDDLVHGRMRVSTAEVGDPVLLRADGSAAYNFAVVIDDALMGITLILRAADHLSNTARQVLLYEAFGWRPPAFAHVPLVMGPDQTKLSKRHGAVSVAEFRARGYLPEALANYLALLGWSPGEGDELLPLDELARRFRVEDVGRRAGVFDPEKLSWMNRHYLKAAAPGRLASLVAPFLRQAGWLTDATPEAEAFLAAVVPLAAGSVDRLDEVPARLRFLFAFAPTHALADATVRREAQTARPVVEALVADLRSGGAPATRDQFRAVAARIREQTGARGRALFQPIRLALTGAPAGMELDLAVPAIERGAALPAGNGLVSIPGVLERAEAFLEALKGR